MHLDAKPTSTVGKALGIRFAQTATFTATQPRLGASESSMTHPPSMFWELEDVGGCADPVRVLFSRVGSKLPLLLYADVRTFR